MAKKEFKKRLVLLDVHAILHRGYHALPDFTTSKGEPTGALYGLSLMLIKIIGELKPDYIVACYDLPEPTFRKKMYEAYKAGRKKADEGLIEQIIRSRAIFNAMNIPYYEKAGFEADDLIGTIAEKAKEDKDLQVVIASGDLDTTQLISGNKVVVYTLKKGIKDTVIYNEEGIKERFGFGPEHMADYKGLRGDPSDNIIGIKGIGEKTAETLIIKFGSIENIYKTLKKDESKLEEAGIKERMIGLLKDGEEEALFSKTLATIKRDVPIDFKMPEKSWQESVDMEKIKKVFTDLEFRTLAPRLEQNLVPSTNLDMPCPSDSSDLAEGPPSTEISPERLKKAFIAVWLLNSEKTEPTLEDVYHVGQSENFDEAEKNILKEIEKNGLTRVYEEIELPLIPIIDEAEKKGILIDREYLKKLSEDLHKKLTVLETSIWGQAGGEFNINSPKQLGEILFEKMNISKKGIKKTPTGAISTRESELEKLAEENPIVKEILEQRELQKLLSTYVDAIPPKADENGRIHTHLNQTGTTTGRMSSNDPNLQNIPTRGDYGQAVRKAFIASPGWKIAALDYSQIEMRVLAWLTDDQILIQTFRDGKDVHSAVASKVFGVPESEVTKEMRRRAKVINFGIIYGMGIRALKKNLGSTMEEAETFYSNYFEKFPKIKEYFEKIKQEAREKGYTVTYFGRRRYFRDINSKLPYLRSEAERMAMNAPIQGTATADIIKIAMRHVDEMLKEKKLTDKAHLLLQVHDELLYEIKDDEDLSEIIDLIKLSMEKAVSINLPLLVNASVGKSWGELNAF